MGIVGFTSDGAMPLGATMDDVFSFSWGKDAEAFEKNKGSTGTVGIDTQGAMNAIYGPFLQNLAYNQHNTYAVLGQKPYRTGRRFQEGLSLAKGDTTGVVRGGLAPNPTFGNYVQCEMPYKVSAKRQAMNLGYTEIGDKSIDDVMMWEDFFALEGKTWLWSINNDLLRPVGTARATGNGHGGSSTSTDPTYREYVGFESIDRIISNYDEGEFIDGNSASSMLNVPWAMADQMPSTDSAAALAKYRNPDVSGAVADNNFNCYVDHNYTAGNTDGTASLRQLDLGMIDSLFLSTMPYWQNNSTTGKACLLGYDTLQKVQTLLQPQQRYQGFVGAQFDVNGVKTVEGQNTGFQVATYNGVPLVPDYMMCRGTAKDTSGGSLAPYTAGVGNIYLIDNDIIFNGVLQAPVVNLSENPLITGRYTRLCDMYCMGETQAVGPFKGLGKIIHLA